MNSHDKGHVDEKEKLVNSSTDWLYGKDAEKGEGDNANDSSDEVRLGKVICSQAT